MIEEKTPITFHLAELRRRILFSLTAWLIGSIAAYAHVEDIIAVISAPAGKLYFLNPAEVFFSYLQIAAVTGLFVTLPIHCYELWRFLRPGLQDKESRAFVWFMPAALILWYGGAAFSFFVVFPQAVQFFLSFSAVSLQPMFSLAVYLSFFIAFVLPFAIGFELPLALIILAHLGLVTGKSLRKKRRVFIVGAFIFAGVVSPTTDMITQTAIAVPLIFLYEGTILFMRFMKP